MGSNYLAVLSGRDMQTQYWIKSLQINLKAENYIDGEADFKQHSISHTGNIKSVKAEGKCWYNSDYHVWNMSINGEINISFSVTSLTGLVPPSVQVTFNWESSRLVSHPGHSPLDLHINGTIFQSNINPIMGATIDILTAHMKVGSNILQISTPHYMKSYLFVRAVYINGNHQGYLQHQFEVAVEKDIPALLEIPHVLDVVPSLTIGDDGAVHKIVLIYTSEQVNNLPAKLAGAPVSQIVSETRSAGTVLTAEALTPLPVLQGGLQIGPTPVRRGTLGAVMFTSNYHIPNFVTAAHVAKVAESNGRVTLADILYAPNESQYINPNYMAGKTPAFADGVDAAAYFLNEHRAYKEGVDGICDKISGVLAPYRGMRVIKNGAATGITRGRVEEIRSKIIIIGPLQGEESTYISKNGDSGALWLTEDHGYFYAVALLSSGRSSKNKNYSIGIKMNTVINALANGTPGGRALTFMKQTIHDGL